MSDLFDYLSWRGDLSFAQVPFNAVDGVILARLAYLPFDPVLPTPETSCVLGEAVEALPSLPEKRGVESDRLLVAALANSARFRGLVVHDYVNQLDAQTQFSALTVSLPGAGQLLCFRGTDNTLVGWKEDFNMAFVCPVPAQELALQYLTRIAAQNSGSLRLLGHSKGGNLAVYAGAFAGQSVQVRIAAVYNYDGPGFDAAVLQTPGYQRICPRMETFVPQSSVVGMLLWHEEQYTVVSSTQTGIWQHDVYSWGVHAQGFDCLGQVGNGSRFLDGTLKEFLRELDPGQREIFVETIFSIMVQTNAKTMRELSENWFRSAVSIARSYKNLDESTRKAVTHALGTLFRSAKAGYAQIRNNT